AALDEVSIGDREVFKDALRATMVKRGEDIPAYEHLFALYCSACDDGRRDAFEKAAQGGAGGKLDLEALMRQLQEGLEKIQGPVNLSELAPAPLAPEPSRRAQSS